MNPYDFRRIALAHDLIARTAQKQPDREEQLEQTQAKPDTDDNTRMAATQDTKD